MSAGLAQPRKTSEKVNLEHMTQEAWEAELACCQCVTEDHNQCRSANKAATLAQNYILSRRLRRAL
jgi:hypothetical protein